jgi:two-component sensor histidine kinase
LQLAGVTNLEAREQLQKIESRIRALSFVNAQLQVGARANVADLGQYLMAIVSSLFNFQEDAGADVKLTTKIAQVEISTQRAQAIGLILNEFLTNSFKYAFTAGTGTFTLSLTHQDAQAKIVMADDGPGIPEDATPGLGHNLIEVLTKQLEGKATWTSSGKGTTLTLEFPSRIA